MFRRGVILFAALVFLHSEKAGAEPAFVFDRVVPSEEQSAFERGEALFSHVYRPEEGLGPLYDAVSCATCHVNVGRGFAPDTGLVARISVGPADAPKPHPSLGHQLQSKSIPDLTTEGALTIRYTSRSIALAGEGAVSLRVPHYSVRRAEPVMIGPRVAPPLFGLGALAAIPEEQIRALADPEDKDGDGISGRVHVVRSAADGQKALGRFGLKANVANLAEQVSLALSADMGLSTALFPWHWGDCTVQQVGCRDSVDTRTYVEVPAPDVDALASYSALIGVPVRQSAETEQHLQGARLFENAGCATCHIPSFTIPEGDVVRTIKPYTDLLLHDMGEALADNRPDGEASGSEWRTAPLWGLGLTQALGGQEGYLHDGRARTVLEAILWHGGEAAVARDRVIAMSPEQRAALLSFLESL